jgi:UDP-N-acetyl-D-mannosaminuronate dehydrogenase
LLASVDAAVIATDHSAFDYERIGRVARLVIDTPSAMRATGGTEVVDA